MPDGAEPEEFIDAGEKVIVIPRRFCSARSATAAPFVH